MAMVPRIHLDATLSDGALLPLEGDQAHYLTRVLRMRPGERLQVTDGRGARVGATLANGEAGRVHVLVDVPDTMAPGSPARSGSGTATASSSAESPLRITLAQCVSGADKMDWTIEKACELGVAAILPLMSQRSLVRLDAQRGLRKVEHWQRVVTAACLQCGRDLFPTVDPPRALSAWLAGVRAASAASHAGDDTTTRLILAPGAVRRLRDLPPPGGPVLVLVGPESGFDDREVDEATAAGLLPVSLGPRVLRTETAGLAAIAALQTLFGDY